MSIYFEWIPVVMEEQSAAAVYTYSQKTATIIKW